MRLRTGYIAVGLLAVAIMLMAILYVGSFVTYVSTTSYVQVQNNYIERIGYFGGAIAGLQFASIVLILLDHSPRR